MKKPIIAIEKGNILAFATKELAERYLEPIDVENEEYELFDSEGLELDAIVINDWTPIELKDSNPPKRDPEYLKTELLGLLKRHGEEIDRWENASLAQVVEKVAADYPSK